MEYIELLHVKHLKITAPQTQWLTYTSPCIIKHHASLHKHIHYQHTLKNLRLQRMGKRLTWEYLNE